LDLSVFPAFEQKLIEAIAQGSPFHFEVSKEQYTIRIDPEAIRQIFVLFYIIEKQNAKAGEEDYPLRGRMVDQADGLGFFLWTISLRSSLISPDGLVQQSLVRVCNTLHM